MEAWKIITFILPLMFIGVLSDQSMSCFYGPRGSLMSTCVNATPSYFRATSYRFDNLDQTLKCKNCNLAQIVSNTFDISGNEIKTLDISNSSIRVLEKKSFVGLVFMKKLILENNYIEMIIPETFQGIKNLEELNIANNSIKKLIANAFIELIMLTDLDLSNNKISDVEQHSFAGLVSLQNLNLGNNLIEKVCDIFTDLPEIRTINLKHNMMRTVPSYCFAGLGRVTDLDLSENKIETVESEAFLGLILLERLNLASNGLKNLSPLSFAGLYNLEILNLKSNNISDIRVGFFRGLHNLRDLDLSINGIGSFKTGFFSGLPELRSLNLSSNRIRLLEKTGILTMPNLHTLDFSKNNIYDIDYKAIAAHVPRITRLELKNNSLPCYIVEEMKRYFKDDNILINTDSYEQPCNTSRTSDSTIVIDEGAAVSEAPRANHDGDVIALYVLMSLILISIAALFYLQYRSNKDIKDIVGKSNCSEVQLICSSDLEARERGDY